MHNLKNMEQELKCPFCGRVCKDNSGYLNHTRHCKQNPDYKPHKNKGCVHTPEQVEQQRLITKALWDDPCYRNKQHDTRNTDEYKNKMSGENNPFYGKHHTEENKQKMGEIHTALWEDDEYRNMMIDSFNTPEGKQNRINSSIKRYENPEQHKILSDAAYKRLEDPEERRKISEALNRPDVKQKLSERSVKMWEDPAHAQKVYDTKRKNGTFNSSKIEIELQEWFKSQNIDFLTEYTSEQYPTRCDFYLPKYDLYIEIQGHPTHGKEPFNPDNPEHIKMLDELKSKATSDNMYNTMINVWTIRDPKKRNTAKANNLNWIEIFSIDLEECVNIIQKHI